METVSTDIGAEIRRANGKFESAFGNGDALGVASLYTEDSVVLPPGSSAISGKQDIQRFWQGAMDMGVKQVKLESVEAEQHGETAVELGQYTLSGENNQTIDQGKYIVIWRRENGQWKLRRDIWNSSSPA